MLHRPIGYWEKATDIGFSAPSKRIGEGALDLGMILAELQEKNSKMWSQISPWRKNHFFFFFAQNSKKYDSKMILKQK